jgi:hypothetical protein
VVFFLTQNGPVQLLPGEANNSTDKLTGEERFLLARSQQVGKWRDSCPKKPSCLGIYDSLS